MSNRSVGNAFEAEFCDILADHGFWVHNLAQNSSGQPADVIAAKNGTAYLIDCKVCSRGRFQFTRVEENQWWAMTLWSEDGNGNGWFAIKFDNNVYMLDTESIESCRNDHVSIDEEIAALYGQTLEEWIESCA